MKSIQWNKMSDAPTDGTIVLLHRAAARIGVGNRIIAAAFYKEFGVWAWPDEVYDEYDREEFNRHIENNDCFEALADHFIGWLPLPEALDGHRS